MRIPLPPGTYRLTDGFGYRDAVYDKNGKLIAPAGGHTGQDYAAPAGTAILAAHTGTILRIWWDVFKSGGAAGGNMVSIRGNDGYETRYAHMLDKGNVRVGQTVTEGQQIGRVGMTGAATGNHLHFEVLKDGKFLDPLTVLNNNTGSRKKNSMTTLYWKNGTKTYALAGDSPGTSANWIEFSNDDTFANEYAAVHGRRVALSAGTFDSFRARYTEPLRGVGGSGVAPDVVALDSATIDKLTAPRKGTIQL